MGSWHALFNAPCIDPRLAGPLRFQLEGSSLLHGCIQGQGHPSNPPACIVLFLGTSPIMVPSRVHLRADPKKLFLDECKA